MRFERNLTMVLADKATYFRRFTVKFVEIVAAGIGTAVSGYVVAYVTGHLSWFTPAAVKPASPAPQAISTPVEPKKTASIEATVRAALASHHDVSDAAPSAAPPRPALVAPVTATPVSAAPVATTPVAATPATEAAPPLATTEIKSVPVADTIDAPLPASGPDGWPSDPTPMGGRLAAGSSRLPPQPPPVNINVLGALKRLF